MSPVVQHIFIWSVLHSLCYVGLFSVITSLFRALVAKLNRELGIAMDMIQAAAKESIVSVTSKIKAFDGEDTCYLTSPTLTDPRLVTRTEI